jgi:hypothetical protein
MPTKRRPAGRVSAGGGGSRRRRSALPPGPPARQRSATAWSVMDSYSAVKVSATARQGLSKQQTTRPSGAGVWTVLARTKALHSRAM